jgi:hypothetical protein
MMLLWCSRVLSIAIRVPRISRLQIVDAAAVDPGDEMPIVGTCRLCHKNADLQVSHFLPNAVYAQLREDALKNPHPVLMTEDDSIISSKQIAEHLLCFDCEQRFSKLGESWVLGNMARVTSFPLQDMLTKAKPLGISPDQTFACYSVAATPGIDMDALIYFALSIFWRGAAHQWRNIDKGLMEGIKLGPYEEPIRKFLLGGPFPDDIVVQVAVWPTKDVIPAAYTPRKGKAPGYHAFNFMIPGIEFRLLTGKQIPDDVLSSCSHASPQKLIYATMQTVTETIETFGKIMSHSKPSKSLLGPRTPK